MIRLREFTERDAAVLQQKQMPGVPIEEIGDMIRGWQTKTYRGKRFEMYAMTEGDDAVGSVSLYARSGSIVSVGIEVFSEERGKGSAEEGMKRILERAKDLGYRVIWDQVAANNQPSIRLHEKLGFETDGTLYKNAKGREVLLYILCL